MRKKRPKPDPTPRAELAWTRLAAFLGVLCLSLAATAAADKKKPRAAQALLFGSVFQENGFSLRGARVVASNADRPKEKKETVTDLQGEFALRVPAGKGRYQVEVSAQGFLSASKTVEVAGDERIDLTFRLAPLNK